LPQPLVTSTPFRSRCHGEPDCSTKFTTTGETAATKLVSSKKTIYCDFSGNVEDCPLIAVVFTLALNASHTLRGCWKKEDHQTKSQKLRKTKKTVRKNQTGAQRLLD
jgi:hypothetical protein